MIPEIKATIQKWDKITASNKNTSIRDIFTFCMEIGSSVAGIHWTRSEVVELMPSPNYSYYDMVGIYYLPPETDRLSDMIGIEYLSKGVGHDEDELNSFEAYFIERRFNKGRERFNIYIVRHSDYSPLFGRHMNEEILERIHLIPEERKTMLQFLSKVFLHTILQSREVEGQEV